MNRNLIKTVLLLLLIIQAEAPLLSQEVVELNNGLTVILDEDHKVPLATFQVWIKTGSIYESDLPGSGITHFVEHLLFTDTQKRTGLEIAGLMKKYGCDMNGYTSFERTVYHFTMPSENLEKCIPIIKELIFEPAFKSKEVDKERNVILKEINMNVDDPDRFFNRLIFSSSYQSSPYRFPVIGFPDLFKKITRENIMDYYKKRYIPDNMAIIVAGDFNSKDIREEIERKFGSLERRFLKSTFIPDEPEQTGYKKVSRIRGDIKIPRIALAFKTVDIRSQDLFALDVLSMVLSRGETSVLKSILQEKMNKVVYIDSYSYTPLKKGLFVIEANVNPAVSTEEVKDDILEIIRKIKQTLTVKELEKIKMIALKDHYKSRETINSRASDLGINWAIADNIKFSEYYVDGLRKVSRKDLVKVAEKYFSRNNLTYIELLPGIEEKGSQINESKQEESVTKTESLKNGLAMILHRDNSLPFISISLVFKGGVLFEPATKKGLTYFMSRLLLSGTKKYSRKRLISTIEDKGGDITSFAGNNSFGIRIEVFKSDAEEALKILKDLVLNCTFPLKEVNRIRGEILQEIRSTDERIFDTGKKLLLQEMYGKYDYSYANTGETNTIKMISSTDIRDHYKKLVQSGNCILSVAGDIRIKDIKEMAESVFKQWKKGQVHLSETAFDLPVEIKKEVKKSVDKKQSLLFLSYYGISVRDQDRIKAELLWNILNGQGSRLFTNLREKKELAYYTGMFPFYGLTTGLFVFYVGTVRDKLELSRKGLFEEINDLIKKGVTEKELQSAKKEFLMDKYRSFQSPNSISFEYALEQLYNGRVLSMHDYKEMIDSIDLITMNRFVRARLADKPYKMIILEGE